MSAVDVQAEALLLALVERTGGDWRAALVTLAARVTIEDIAGESYERALARAVADLFERRAAALPTPSPPA